MTAGIGGLDLLVLTGGVGEHAPAVRAGLAVRLGCLGAAVDRTSNERTTSDGDISAVGSAARTVVVTARQDLEIQRVRGHEKVPTGGQVEVPTGGQIGVPTLRVVS